MDSREQASGLENELLEKYGINVLRKWLPVGDYVINDEIAIERKTSIDFSKSIIDGRLFKQVVKMKLFFPTALLIIEGESESFYFSNTNIHPLCVKGALVNLSIRWKIPIIFSRDVEDTASFIWLIGTQNTHAKKVFSLRTKPRLRLFRRNQLHILNGLPGIGNSLADRLIEHFGNVEKVITASEKQLKKISGIGTNKAKKIREIVSLSR